MHMDSVGEETCQQPNQQQQQAQPNMADHLRPLDAKLDRLPAQMEACLLGIQVFAGKKGHALHGHGHLCGPIASPDSHHSPTRPSEKRTEGPQVTQFEDLNLRLPAGGAPKFSACSESGEVSNPTSYPSYMSAMSTIPVVCDLDLRISQYITIAAEDETTAGRRTLGPVQLKLWRLMNNPESSLAAETYNRLSPAFVLLVVLFNMIESLTGQTLSPGTSMGIECCVEAVFLMQVSTQFVCCPYRRSFLRRGYNVIDVLSVLPLALRVYSLATGGGQEVCAIILGGFVPVVRLLKTMRHFQTSRLLVNAFILAKEAVPVLLFYYAVVWLLFTGILYTVEERSNIASLPDPMWLTVVTMTTIGYGDVVPRTAAGKVATTALVLVSTLYMAIPLGIIGSCFSAVWQDRDKILLFERLRSCLVEAGCSNLDIPLLFSRFSKSDRCSVDAVEFIDMCVYLKMGLCKERLMILFDFWSDGDGRICATTFQNILYPQNCLRELEMQRQARADFTSTSTRTLKTASAAVVKHEVSSESGRIASAKRIGAAGLWDHL